MENKKVVITGGAGFIGSHLAQRLAKRNHCTVVDDLSTGRIQNIAEDVAEQRLEFIQGTILDLELLKRIFKDADCVFHQAAMVSVPRSMENPLACSLVNVIGTLNVLLAARDNRVAKVAYASSSSVYGDTPELPRREQAKPSPLSPYAVSKLAGELYCRVFSNAYGLATVCLRYFNVYGRRQDPDSQYAAVIPRFIKRVLNGEAPIIFGDGSQTRDFTFVEDVVEANILAMESSATGVFNIGTGRSISISDLANVIMDVTGRSFVPLFQEKRAGDVEHSVANISKASTFGYRPKYSIKEGITEILRQTTISADRKLIWK